MIRKTFTVILASSLLAVAFCVQAVRAQTAFDTQRIEQTRSKVLKLGAGRSARVEVKLRDDTRLKGYISAANADSFTITDAKTGATQTVAYTDVAQVKKTSGGLSPRAWAFIGGAAAAAIIVGVTVVKPVLCDGGAGC